MADGRADEEPGELQVDRLRAAVDELATLLPRVTGPAAGLPGRIADVLAGIDERLAAVERMGREQFELDQRLTALDESLAELARPLAELAPTLRHVDQLVERLGRIEPGLHHGGATPGDAEGADKAGDAAVLARLDRLVERHDATAEQLRVVREALAGTVARSAETTEAVARLEHRVDAIASLLETVASDDPRHRTTELVGERIERVRETAGGVGDAIREELRRRRTERPPGIDTG
jgi:hypothetical protein